MAIKTFSIADVKINGTAGTSIGNAISATLTVNMDTAEKTAFLDTWKSYLALAKSWSLSVNAHLDNSDTAASSLRTEFISGDCVVTSVTMYVTASSVFIGDTILTGYNEGASVNAPDSLSLTFQGNGALTYTAG